MTFGQPGLSTSFGVHTQATGGCIEISGLDIGERRFKFFAAQDSVNIMRTTDNSISEVISEPTPEPTPEPEPTSSIPCYYYNLHVDSTAFTTGAGSDILAYMQNPISGTSQNLYADENLTQPYHSQFGNWVIQQGSNGYIVIMVPSNSTFPGFLSVTPTLLQGPS